MNDANDNWGSARRLAVHRSGVVDAANELVVECPMVKAEVLLQRCAFCEHGQGLLLDSSNDGLTLRCSFPQPSRAKPLRTSEQSQLPFVRDSGEEDALA